MRTTNGLNKSDKSSSTTSTVVSTTKSPLSPKIPTKPSTLIVNNSTNKPPVPYKPPGLSQKSLINNNNDNNTSSAAPIQSTAVDINGNGIKDAVSPTISSSSNTDEKCRLKNQPKKVMNDTTANPKLDNTSKCRPLKMGSSGSDTTSGAAVDGQTDNNNVYNACETGTGSQPGGGGAVGRGTRFPTLGQCSRNNDSLEERTVCCTNLAVNLYNKALESAKRALPNKSKQSRQPQFGHSFGDDFSSIGPDGFNYLDDGQTECSYDYRDIEFNRDSWVPPDLALQMLDSGGGGGGTDSLPKHMPVLIENPDPINFDDLQSRYGLPGQPSSSSSTGAAQQPINTATGAAAAKAKVGNEEPTKQLSETTKTTSPVNNKDNVDDNPIVKKSNKLIVDSPPPPPTPAPTVNNDQAIVIEIGVPIIDNNGVVAESSAGPKTSKQRPIVLVSSPAPVATESIPSTSVLDTGIDKPNSETLTVKFADTDTDNNNNNNSSDMDLLAKRASKLIIESAMEEVKRRSLERSGSGGHDLLTLQHQEMKLLEGQASQKSSTESSAQKELKRERKLLEKKLREEEKLRKRAEREARAEDRREKRSLFDRFRSSDRQKQKIMKKQKQFEKMKAKAAAVKAGGQSSTSAAINKTLTADDQLAIDADDEYEPSPIPTNDEQRRRGERHYEEIAIDDNEDKQPAVSGQQTTINNENREVLEDVVVKYELIENIREIGVTYVPSRDASGSDTEAETGDHHGRNRDNNERKSIKNRMKKKARRVVGFGPHDSFRVLREKVSGIFPLGGGGNKRNKTVTTELKSMDTTTDLTNVPQIVVCDDQQQQLATTTTTTTITTNDDKPPTADDNVSEFRQEYENVGVVHTFGGGGGGSEHTGADDDNYNVSQTYSTVSDTATTVVPLNKTTMIGQYETEEDDDRTEEQQFLERVSRVGSGHKKPRKKSKTRVKLDRFKAKAMESLPKITSIGPKLRELMSSSRRMSGPTVHDLEYERFMSTRYPPPLPPHMDRRYRGAAAGYDSDFDVVVSDSELCDSLRRSGGAHRLHVYEEIAATQERLDAYMSPVSGPLRPPRRFSAGLRTGVGKVASVPTLHTQPMIRGKRQPPPRPPPPRPPAPKVSITLSESEWTSMDSSSVVRRCRQRVPAHIYYSNVRLNYKPKRRFMHNSRVGGGQKASWRRTPPNIHQLLAIYDHPKPPIPVPAKPKPGQRITVRLPTRVQIMNARNAAMDRMYDTGSGGNVGPPIMAEQTVPINRLPPPMPASAPITISPTRNWGPKPPPRRHRRAAERSQTMDPLDWQPFSWKFRRCRSLTELDVRQSQDSLSTVATVGSKRLITGTLQSTTDTVDNTIDANQPRIIRTHNKRPERPPLPSYSSILSSRTASSSIMNTTTTSNFTSNSTLATSARSTPYSSIANNFHLYASVSKGSGGSVPNVPDHRTAANNNDWSKRPLPPPPRPPKPMVRTRDVSISTGDDLNHIPPTSLPMANRTPQLCDRQTQLDARNNSLYEDMNGNNIDDSDDTEDMDLNNKTPTNPLTPTTPTNRPIGGGVRGGGGGSGGDDEDVEELFPYGCVNNDLERYRSDGLADSQSTLSSLTTTTASTQWFDAELGPDGQQRQVEGGSRFYRDWDQETINDDISSIASNYQSFASEYRTNSEDREATPVADADDTTDFRLMPAVVDDELPVPSQALKSATNDEMIGMTATGASGVQKSAPMRSQSTRVMSTSVSCKTVQPSRHSLPVNIDDNNDDEPIIEDLDERILFGSVGAGGIGMTPDLHRELRQAIDKRQSNLSSADSTGISSSDVSLHETLMTNNTTIGANNNNNNNNSNGCNSSSNNSDNTSSLSINSDSNSDLSTGKHRHPIQVPNTATTATDTVGCRIAIDRSESVESLANNNNLSSDGEGDDYSLSSANKQTPEYRKRKQNQKLYFIAKELYSSELVFIDVLQLLNNDFRRAVTDHIPDDVLQQILNYLPQLLKINEQLASELKVRIDNWADHQRISDVLVRICPFLKQYSQYIGDFGQITAIYDDALHRYPAFQSAVKEFELTARCQKLSVKHYMLKPVQRIPQYRLLLQDYLNHLSDESDDYADTCCALKIVSQVAEHANNSMKCNENLQKMLSIQQSIITGKCEVIKPGRVFIKEGELMKLSRKGMQERYFILFNDSLLYLTCVQHGVYRVNHELSLTGMRVSLPKQQDFQNEFSIISHTRSFSLAARSPKEREDWVNELNKAIKENTNKRISFAKSRSLIGDSPDIPVLALGASAPVWIPDARVTMCQLCTEEFTVTYRRHHCRCCGNVVCSACSTNKAPMPYLKNRTERVCDECFDGLRLQMERLEIERKHRSDASGASLDSQSATVRTPSTTASASDTDDTTATGADGSAWSLKEWQQIFSRTAERKSHRKAKHRYVPSVLKEVRANDVGSLISGYLHRRESRKQWKNYWYVIKDMVLYTYKASEDVAALKSEPLLGFKVEPLRDSVDGINAKQLVQLSHPGQPTIIFRAETVGQAERWLKAMQTATTLD